MTRRQSRWVNVIIVALVFILRSPTFLPSLYNGDEGYYGTIANDTLDGGTFYRTAVDTKPPGIYYIYVAVFKVAGKNNLLAVHILAILVVVATALVVRGLACAWLMIGQERGVVLVMRCSSTPTGRVTHSPQIPRFWRTLLSR
jgi:4-amino-4-deoxy-L-arabinose transferase-like glycosyltransferase